MTRTYANPAAFKAALESRLMTHATEAGRPINRVRQLLVMERFLARVIVDFEAAVLKGGLAMELRQPGKARTTKDVDLRLMGRSDAILDRLQAAGRRELGDFLSYEVRIDSAHPVIEADGLPYEGQRFRAEAVLAGKIYGSAFGVDVALAEPLVGTPDRLVGSDALDFIGIIRPEFLAYPVATHIAEKLHAYTLPRPRPNSRVKDLPDIALLAQQGPLDAEELRTAIAATFANRATHPVPTVVPDPPAVWANVYARMARDEGLAWANVDVLLAAVRGFLGPVLVGGARIWDPALWGWVTGFELRSEL